MEVNFLQTKFSELALDTGLRFDYKFYDFVLRNNFKIIPESNNSISLKQILISNYQKYEYQEDEEYKGLPTGAEYYNENGDIIDTQLVTKAEHPDRLCYKLEKGSILISSLKGAKAPVLYIDFKNTDKYVVSNGFYIFKVNNTQGNEKFVWYFLRTKLIRDILDDHLSSGIGISSYKESNLLRIKIPFVPLKIQETVLSKIEPLQEKINICYKKIESLQGIIDDVFVKYGIKGDKFCGKQEEPFLLNFQKIEENLFLRLGAQYYTFFEVHQGLLFDENGKHNQVPLGRLIKKYKAQVLKKGVLDQTYILLDLEQLEAKTGRILDETNEVEEIGSDKVVFCDSDIVISKLRPYLSYVFINNKNKNYIGTTELIPFKLINQNTKLEYVKYCLLSIEYIKKSELLMYGKEHPRIDIRDLLAIKIPLPDLEAQQKIVSEIQQREEKSNQYKEEIKKLREEIDNLIYKTLKQGEYGFY
jgi:restriction endonuclease S subunit